MDIGVIVFSQTGNTYAVARLLQEKLAASGHTVNLERVTAAGNASTPAKQIELTHIPATAQYDAVVFGAPVQAFSLPAVMTAYLNQLSSLNGTKVACFVTKQLPFYWTGGHRAIAAMKRICWSKGAEVCGTEIIVWSAADREQQISKCLDRLSRLF